MDGQKEFLLPDDPYETCRKIESVRSRRNKRAVAARIMRQALADARHKDQPCILNLAGDMALQANDFSGARRHYTATLAGETTRDSERVYALVGMGRTYFHDAQCPSKNELAHGYVMQALKINPKSFAALGLLTKIQKDSQPPAGASMVPTPL